MSFVFSRLINLSGAVVGVLALANGGTNKALTAVNGGLVWSDADSMEITAAGTAQSGAASRRKRNRRRITVAEQRRAGAA